MLSKGPRAAGSGSKTSCKTVVVVSGRPKRCAAAARLSSLRSSNVMRVDVGMDALAR